MTVGTTTVTLTSELRVEEVAARRAAVDRQADEVRTERLRDLVGVGRDLPLEPIVGPRHRVSAP